MDQIVLDGEIEKSVIEDGVKYVKCSLLADSRPAVMPTTGENIKGLQPTDHLMYGTVIYTKAFEVAILGANGWGNWQ